MVTTRRLRALCALFPDFDTLDVSLFCSVLSLAGRRWNHRAFDLTLATLADLDVPGGPLPLRASQVYSELAPCDVIFVPGGRGMEKALLQPAFVTELARLGQSARALCAVGMGQLALVRAGLLRAPVCCSLESAAELARRFPDVAIDSQREVVIEPPSYRGQSSLSALPVALELVADVLGAGEADHIGRALGQRQRAPRLSFTR